MFDYEINIRIKFSVVKYMYHSRFLASVCHSPVSDYSHLGTCKVIIMIMIYNDNNKLIG